MRIGVKRDFWSIYLATGLAIALFAVLSIGTLGLQQRIAAIAKETRDQMVPQVQARFRIVRNIELLRNYGNVAYQTTDRSVRLEAGFISTLLTTHPQEKGDPEILSLLEEANTSVQLIVKGDLAASDWPAMDRRLAVHADQLSIAAETMTLNRAIQIEEATSYTRNFALAQALLFLISTVAIVAWGRVLLSRMKSKNRYFNELSHDFRQRVHNMELSLGSAAQGSLDAAPAQLARLQDLMGDLQRYLDNFLDVARMETVVVRPTMAEFTVSLLFQQLALQVEDLAEHHGVDLRFRHSPLILHSDEKWLCRVMENLIVNALKFSRGKVLVAARRRGEELQLLVFDNGQGISGDRGPGQSPMLIPDHAFESFAQGSNAAEVAGHGFGLGLAMVKRTVKMLNGRIEVCSAAGRGTVVRVRLPRRQ